MPTSGIHWHGNGKSPDQNRPVFVFDEDVNVRSLPWDDVDREA